MSFSPRRIMGVRLHRLYWATLALAAGVAACSGISTQPEITVRLAVRGISVDQISSARVEFRFPAGTSLGNTQGTVTVNGVALTASTSGSVFTVVVPGSALRTGSFVFPISAVTSITSFFAIYAEVLGSGSTVLGSGCALRDEGGQALRFGAANSVAVTAESGLSPVACVPGAVPDGGADGGPTADGGPVEDGGSTADGGQDGGPAADGGAAAASLTVTGFPTPTPGGVAHSFTVTAVDAYGNVATGYSGTVSFSSSDPQAVLPGASTLANGTGTFNTTLKTVGTQSITASDGTLSGQQTGIVVTPGSAASLTVTGFPNPTTAGVSQSFTVTAMDAYGNVATGYAGTVSFSSSDPQAVLPGASMLANGTGTFNATLKTAATQSITASDGTLSVQQTGIVVTPGSAASLTVTGFPNPTTAGVSQSLTVTAMDAYGNVATGYAGTVSFSSSDAQAVLPAASTLANGTGTFNATLKTLGTQSITVGDGTLSGSQTGIIVNDAPPSGIVYSPAGPYVYWKGIATTSLTPRSTGGAVVSWSITPNLTQSTGLSFDSATGVISGTPSAFSAATSYTVTASNSGGETTTTLVIAVDDGSTVGTKGGIAAGEYHNCALVNGGVQCWGRNISGQLGDNTTTDRYVPVQVKDSTGTSTLTGVQAIAAGHFHTCALVNGGVQCWGRNISGQLGDNTTTDRYVPVQVKDSTGTSTLTGVQAIAAGDNHTCALVNGGVQCWGYNAFGQLGDNTTTERHLPVQVKDSTGTSTLTGVQTIAAGFGRTCALVNGGVQCWGRNINGQLGDNTTTDRYVPVQVKDSTGTSTLTGVQAIAASHFHTCALGSGGVQCWGWNYYGQLGDNTTADRYVPVQVKDSTGTSTLTGVQAIAPGGSHTCALVNGGVQCWGLNDHGQLGDNTTAQRVVVPVQVKDSTGTSTLTGVQAIAAGESHTCALVNGGVQCWGLNLYGGLGDNTTWDRYVPVQVKESTGTSNFTGLQAIAAGQSHTCALVAGGLQCWGLNGWGQLGDNTTTRRDIPVLVKDSTGTSNLAGVQAIAGGVFHTCALVNGGVQCWGGNGYGQLGDNTTTDRHLPVQVKDSTGTSTVTGVQAIAAGRGFTCALVSGGVQCWGQNFNGQLGDNTTTDRHVPVQVKDSTGTSSLTGVQAIVANGEWDNDHVCALVNGGVQCWGGNNSGQLGDNTITERHLPVQVKDSTGTSTLTGVQAIAAGRDHTCALVSGGVQCWGLNVAGELGDNTTTDRHLPVPVRDSTGTSTLTGVQAIAAGSDHTCALVNGGVQCWGYNAYGQLGDNTTTQHQLPVQVKDPTGTSTLTGVQAIAAGDGHHTCALVNGGVQCWGLNADGQLGDNTTTQRNIPVQVWPWAP
jgi:alpha-tubulin suppressor-like RCC1 family protein